MGRGVREKKISVIAAIAVFGFVVFVVAYSPRREWVEIPGTGGIHYDRKSLKQDGNMAYVALKNENPETKRSVKATDIVFTAAFYCNRGKVRTLGRTVRYEDGSVKSDSENHLEADPASDELNESHDLQDIGESPGLEPAYRTFCE